ncbi:hypothetical protein QTL97_09705 [Sporosarcina thermotolerans]|uniref:DUF4830 domain-containing protein n=1 Tax=Sporosarcina thermotolerans TaxID=633404 RepID=A0AAW9A760_9BACL|nr:hypothetical protein [Sporosarcina thermotolerans]MDW0117212.1 hypothetical protein [Sporosarcina thermotolerans]WHT47383.1 hypothetical protein QNH10_14420 [Sporosarcina thermotolerans]
MKRLGIIIGVAVGLVIILVIVNQKFMFNPILFRSNAITYNNWSDYTYPSKIEYLYWDDKNGWNIGNESSNNKEIKNIFRVLKDGLENAKVARNEFNNSAIKREMKLIIRRSDGLILLQFDYYEGGNMADLGNDNFIELPSSFKSILLEKTFN